MKRAPVVALAVWLSGCGGCERAEGRADLASAPPTDPSAQVAALVDENLQAEIAFSPSLGTWLGARGFDDRLDDRRPEAVAREAARLEALLARLRRLSQDAVSAAPRSALTPTARLDLELLEHRTAAASFELTELRPFERNPVYCLDLLAGALDDLVADATTPAALAERTRVAALTERLRHVRQFLDEARRNLRGSTPSEVLLARSRELARTVHDFVAETLPRTVQPGDARTLEDFRNAAADAARALEDFTAFLARELKSRVRIEPLGRERFFELLRRQEALELAPEELQAALERALREARRRYDDAARVLIGNKPPPPPRTPDVPAQKPVDPLRLVEDDHASAEDLPREAQADVDAVLAFAVEHQLVPVDGLAHRDDGNPDAGVSRPHLTVLEMPPHLWGYFKLVQSRPLESRVREPLVLVDTVDKSWREAQKAEHLRALNRSALMLRTLHEVAGHLTLAERNRRAPTTQSKIALAPTFVEGWADYIEHAFLDAGFAAGTSGEARLRLTVERAAVIRLVRALAAVRLHALGHKPEDVQRLLADEAGLSAGDAEAELNRVAADPLVVADAIGRLAIEKLRDDWRAVHSGATLSDFHRALLGHGTPPVAILRRILLPGNSPLL